MAADERPWHEVLKERDPEYHAEVFRYFTPEQWEAYVARQERHGIPRYCEHLPTLMAVAQIMTEPQGQRVT